MPEGVAQFYAESLAQAERHQKTCKAADQCEQIVFPANSSHSFEELPPIQDADAVEEHDQTGQPDRPYDLCLRSKCAEREADEQDGADAK